VADAIKPKITAIVSGTNESHNDPIRYNVSEAEKKTA
jgi:hypothetical protein